MTLLNVTVARDQSFAVLSADSYLSPWAKARGAKGGITTDMAEAVAAAFTNGPAPTVEPVGEVNKLVVYAAERLVLSSLGNAAMWKAWTGVPATIGSPDIHALTAEAPDFLRDFARQLPGEDFIAIAAGWSEREGRAVVVAFQGPEFEPQELPPGNAQHPPADPEAEDHAALEALAVAAADGEDTDGFHIRLARHQVAANRAGRLYPGVVLGGRLSLARIDASGARLRTLGALNNEGN